MEECKSFQTSDTPLAAYLIYKKFKLQEITYQFIPHRKAFFTFFYSNGNLAAVIGEFVTSGEAATGNIPEYMAIYNQLIWTVKEGKSHARQ